MELQLVAIFVIAAAAGIWFVRDEQKCREQARNMAIERTAGYFVRPLQYNRIPTASFQDIPLPLRRSGGLSRDQRAFFIAYQHHHKF